MVSHHNDAAWKSEVKWTKGSSVNYSFIQWITFEKPARNAKQGDGEILTCRLGRSQSFNYEANIAALETITHRLYTVKAILSMRNVSGLATISWQSSEPNNRHQIQLFLPLGVLSSSTTSATALNLNCSCRFSNIFSCLKIRGTGVYACTHTMPEPSTEREVSQTQKYPNREKSL